MSFQELFILMVIALILFGPEDLPDIARALGKIVYEIKKMFYDVTKEFQDVASTPKNVLQNALDETVNRPVKQKAGSAQTEDQSEDKNDLDQEEFLTYDDENSKEPKEPKEPEKPEEHEDPLADLPTEMVSYEERKV